MNGIFIFGLIFLIMCLFIYPRLTKVAPEDECHQAQETVDNNKKYFKIFLIVAVAMVVIGGIMMLF